MFNKLYQLWLKNQNSSNGHLRVAVKASQSQLSHVKMLQFRAGICYLTKNNMSRVTGFIFLVLLFCLLPSTNDHFFVSVLCTHTVCGYSLLNKL